MNELIKNEYMPELIKEIKDSSSSIANNVIQLERDLDNLQTRLSKFKKDLEIIAKCAQLAHTILKERELKDENFYKNNSFPIIDKMIKDLQTENWDPLSVVTFLKNKLKNSSTFGDMSAVQIQNMTDTLMYLDHDWMPENDVIKRPDDCYIENNVNKTKIPHMMYNYHQGSVNGKWFEYK